MPLSFRLTSTADTPAASEKLRHGTRQLQHDFILPWCGRIGATTMERPATGRTTTIRLIGVLYRLDSWSTSFAIYARRRHTGDTFAGDLFVLFGGATLLAFGFGVGAALNSVSPPGGAAAPVGLRGVHRPLGPVSAAARPAALHRPLVASAAATRAARPCLCLFRDR